MMEGDREHRFCPQMTCRVIPTSVYFLW